MALAKCTKDARIKQLKAMHELMMLANDEDIYMTWIYTMLRCFRQAHQVQGQQILRRKMQWH